MESPAVAVVVPSRDRAGYLDVALRSLTSQRGGVPHELLVVDDGGGPDTRAVADAAGAACLSLRTPRGLNAARNAGIGATRAPLVAFVDDDVVAPPGWLAALAEGAAR